MVVAGPPPDPELRTIRATDGYRLTYRVWPAVRPRATLVLFNGIMSNAAWFGPLIGPLRERGYRVVGADRRGSGLNREGRGDAPSAGQLVADARAILEAESDPEGPTCLLGWCWGAALATVTAAEAGAPVDGLVLVTPGLWNTDAVRRAMQRQADKLADGPADATCIDSPIEESMFTTGPWLDGFIRRDADRVLEITPRLVEHSVKLATLAMAKLRRISAPLLVLLAEHDAATDNEATRRALSRLPAPQVEIVTLPTHHGMQFEAPDAVASAIDAFARRLPSPDAAPAGAPAED